MPEANPNEEFSVKFYGPAPTPQGDGYSLIPSALIRLTSISPEAKLYYIVLLDHYDHADGSLTFPDETIIAERCGMHPRRATKARNELLDCGLMHQRFFDKQRVFTLEALGIRS